MRATLKDRRGLRRVRWVRHETSIGVAKVLLPRNWQAVMSTGERLDAARMALDIEAHGMWACVNTKSKVPVVHYWHDSRRTLEEVAFMLGHELGHVSGKPVKRGGWAEEHRADEYGAVARLVTKELSRRGATDARPSSKRIDAGSTPAAATNSETLGALIGMVRLWERFGPGNVYSVSGEPTSLDIAKAVIAKAARR